MDLVGRFVKDVTWGEEHDHIILNVNGDVYFYRRDLFEPKFWDESNLELLRTGERDGCFKLVDSKINLIKILYGICRPEDSNE